MMHRKGRIGASGNSQSVVTQQNTYIIYWTLLVSSSGVLRTSTHKLLPVVPVQQFLEQQRMCSLLLCTGVLE